MEKTSGDVIKKKTMGDDSSRGKGERDFGEGGEREARSSSAAVPV